MQTQDTLVRDTVVTLTVEPASDVAPGATVALCCTLQNTASTVIDGALLRFVLPSEAVVKANDPAALSLPPLAPHSAVSMSTEVALHAQCNDGDELRFEAVLLHADGRLQRSNRMTLRIRARARLHGPRTFVDVQPTEDPHEFLVTCQVANDGTAPARALVVDVPPPAGMLAVESLGSPVFMLEHLGPGESQRIVYRARLSATTMRSVQVTGAAVGDEFGEWFTLASSAPLALTALLSTPLITVTRNGRRLHVTVRGTNAGSGSAYNVTFALRWPAEFVCSTPSLSWNAARVTASGTLWAFARAQIRADGADLSIARIDAGESYELAFDLDATSLADGGTLIVDIGAEGTDAHAEARLEWVAGTDIRLQFLTMPSLSVATGAYTDVHVQVFNAGDNDTTLGLDVDAAPAGDARIERGEDVAGQPFALAAGSFREVVVRVCVLPAHRAHEDVSFSITARAHDGQVTRATLPIRTRDRPSLVGGSIGGAGSPCNVAAHVSDVGHGEPGTTAPGTMRRGPAAREALEERPSRVDAVAGEPLRPGSDSVTLVVSLDRAHTDEAIRVLSEHPPANVLAQVCRLRPLLPTVVRDRGVEVQAALSAAINALDNLFDRLSLKLRLPHVTPTPADCDDPAVRRALCDLFATIGATAPSQPAPGDIASIEVTFDRAWATRQSLLLKQTPCGDGLVLESIFALFAVRADGRNVLTRALEGYLQMLRATVLDPDIEVDGRDPLQAARARLLAALVAERSAEPESGAMYAG